MIQITGQSCFYSMPDIFAGIGDTSSKTTLLKPISSDDLCIKCFFLSKTISPNDNFVESRRNMS